MKKLLWKIFPKNKEERERYIDWLIEEMEKEND